MIVYQHYVCNVEAFSTQRVYHGTSQEAARSIRKNGFDLKKCAKMDFFIPNQRTVLGQCVYFTPDYFKASYIAKQKFGEKAVVLEYVLETGNMCLTGTFCYDWQKKYDSCFLIGKKSQRTFPVDAPQPKLVEYDEIGVGSRIVKTNLKYIACHKVSMDSWDSFELARLEDLVARRSNGEKNSDGKRITWQYIATQFPSRTLWQCRKLGKRLAQKSTWTKEREYAEEENWTPQWYRWNPKKEKKSKASRKWKKNNSSWKEKKAAKPAVGSPKRKYPKSRFRLQSSKISKVDIEKLPNVVQTRNAKYVTKDATPQKETATRVEDRHTKRSPGRESDASDSGDTLFISIPEALLCPNGYSSAPTEICPKGYTSSTEALFEPFQETIEQHEDSRSLLMIDERVFRTIETTNNRTNTSLPKTNDLLKEVPLSGNEIPSNTTQSVIESGMAKISGGMQGEAEMSSFVTMQPIVFPPILQPIYYLASSPVIVLTHPNNPTLFSFCPSPLPKTEPVTFCLNSPEAKEMLNNLGEKGC